MFNFTRIILNQSQGRLPQVYVHLLALHVYLVYEGQVLNEGVTGEKGRYPAFSIDQLEAEGTDETLGALRFTLSSEFIRQRMQLVFPETTLAIAIPKLQQLYIQQYIQQYIQLAQSLPLA